MSAARFVLDTIRREPVIDHYVELDHYSRSIGRRMNTNDLWIAASAAATGAMLLTTDHDFDHIDSSMMQSTWIDPSSATPS